ncbi:MAG: translocation/assembly module TamB domain-containing protein [Magnetococcales bacterium]|nr:translocation/assembly module TamB domain-containing protein [Magnetococcales bacterium]
MNKTIIPLSWRQILQWIFMVLFLMLVLIGILFAALQIDPVRQMLTRKITEIMAKAGTPVEIGPLRGLIPFDVRLDSLTLSDGKESWLIIHNLQWSFSPTALLGGEIFIDHLDIDSVEVRRLPESAESETEQKPAGQEPSFAPLSPLPDFFQLDRLQIKTLKLGETIIPKGGIFTLNGFIRPDADTQKKSLQTVLAARRIDQEGTFFNLKAIIPLEAPLAFTLSAQAQDRSRILETALNHPVGEVVLAIDGQGVPEGWQGRLTASGPHLGELNAGIRLATPLEQLSLTVDGTLVVAKTVLPDNIHPLLTVPSSFSARYLGISNGGWSLEHSVTIPDQLEIAGTVTDLQGAGFLRGNWEVKAPQLEPFSAVAEIPLAGSATLSIRLEGAEHAPVVRVQGIMNSLKVPDFALEQGEWNVTLTQNQELTEGIRDLSLDANAHLSGINPINLPQWPDRKLEMEFNGLMTSPEKLTVTAFKMAGHTFDLTGSGALNLESLAGEVTVKTRIEELSRFKALHQQAELTGTGTLQARIAFTDQWSTMTTQLEGNATGLNGLSPLLSPLLGENPRWQGSAEIQAGSKQIHLKSFALDGQKLTIRAVGLLDPVANATRMETILEITELAALSAPLNRQISGKAQARLILSESLSDPSLAVTMTVEQPSLDNQPFEQLQFNALTNRLVSNPEGNFKLTLSHLADTIQLSSPFRQDGQGRFDLSNLVLEFPDGKLTGPLTIDPASGLVQGQLSGEASQLSALGRLTNLPLEGRAQLNLQLTAEEATGSQQGTASLTVNQLRIPEATVGRLTLDATLIDLTTTPRISLKTRLADLIFGDASVSTVQIGVDGSLSGPLEIAAQAQSGGRVPFAFQSRATVEYGKEHLQIALTEMGGDLDGQPFRLQQPAQLTLKSGQMELDIMSVHWGVATAELRAGLTSEQASARMILDIPLDQALSLSGRPHGPWQGQVEMTVELDGHPNRPRIKITLHSPDIKLNDPSLNDIPKGVLDAQIILENGQLTGTGTLVGLVREPVGFSVNLPLIVTLQPFAATLPANGTLAGELHATAQLERLAGFYPLDLQQIQGEARVDLRLSGNPHAPDLRGALNISKLRYENGLYGTLFQKGKIEIQALGNQVKLVGLKLEDGEKGRITGSGQLALDQTSGFPWTVNVQIEDATIIRRDDLTAKLAGAISVTGNNQMADVSGKLISRRITYFLPESMGQGIDRLDVRESLVVDLENRTAPVSKPSFQTNLNMNLELPGQVFVRGKGLDSEWKGHLDILGRAEAPTITGSLTVKRGQFQAMGRPFNLTNSTIQFDGAYPVSPSFNVQAVLDKKDLLTQISLTGHPESLKLKLSSQPAFPQDEIISRLLFDKTADQISPMQAIRLAATIKSLRDGGPGVMDRFNRAIGVDSLEIEGSNPKSGSLKAGKYLGDKTFFSVERGMADGSGKLSIEHEIRPNIVIETEVGSDSSGGLGILWKKEY